MHDARAAAPCGFLATLLAISYLVTRDGYDAGAGACVVLAGGVALIGIAATATDYTARLLPTRVGEATWRRLTAGFLVGVPLGYATLYAGAQVLQGAPTTLAGVLAVTIAALFVIERLLPRWAGLVEMIGSWRHVCIAACQLSLAFVYLHVQQETLVVMKTGRENLHQALFFASWIVCLAVALPWGVRVRTRSASTSKGRLTSATAVLALVGGAVLFEVDQRELVGLHPPLHQWLEFVALLSLDTGLLLALGSLSLSLPLPSSASLRRMGFAARIMVCLLAIGFVALPPERFGADTRAQVGNTALGPALLSLRPAGRTGETNDELLATPHPALEYERYHDEVQADSPPNILLLTIDTLRGDRIGHPTTPALTQLANRCVNFTRGYAPGPRTAIGLGTLVNGRYSAHLEWDLWRNHRGRTINPRTATPEQRKRFGKKFHHRAIFRPPADGGLVARLREQNVWTMGVVFAGLNPIFDHNLPFALGFDDYNDTRKVKPKVKTPSSERLVDLALEQIERARAQQRGPWFQWLHLFDPHESNGKAPQYDARVRQTDKAVARLLSRLGDLGVRDNTVIMVAGDHGEGLGDHRFDKHGTALYDEQVRVPMLLCMPSTAPRVVDSPASTLDLAATAVALVGGRLDAFDGVNLLPLVKDGRYPKDRPVFLELHRYRGRNKAIGRDLRGVVRGHWKFVHDRMTGAKELYDLDADPRELTNVIGDELEVAADLERLLGSFMAVGERDFPPP